MGGIWEGSYWGSLWGGGGKNVTGSSVVNS